MKKHLLILLFYSFCFNALSQTVINLKSGKIKFSDSSELNLSQENNYCFLTLKDIPTDQEKENLTLLGISFLEYIPKNTYLVNIPKNFNINSLNNASLINVLNVLPKHKLDLKIKDGKYPDWALNGDRLTIKILFYKDYDFSTYRENLASINYVLKYENKSYKSITVEINKEDLNIISKINDVWFIEPIDPPSVAENKTARTLHRSNTVNTQYVGGKKYNGEGINIMMQDDGLVGPHIDRQGRLDQSFCIGCSSNANDDHGDHVSGTIMGAGNLDPTTK